MEKEERIRRMYLEQGMSTTEIAPLVGMSQSGVVYYLKTHHIPVRNRSESLKYSKRLHGKQRKDITIEMRKEAARLYTEEKRSIRQLGEKYKLTNGAIRSLLKTQGVLFRSPSEGLRIRYPNGRFGESASNWKGGRRKTGTKGSYIHVYSPDHPYATKENAVMEHRLVMEKHLGRYLEPNELVHHINGDKKDNRIENLELISSRGAHTREHFARSFRTEQLEQENERLKRLLLDNGITP